jgi:hypothetical protein
MKREIASILALLNILLGGVNALLRSSDELTPHCYHFPAKDFGKSNCVKDTYGLSPKLMLDVGDQAIDFTLSTPTVSLSKSSKPLIVFLL